MGYPPQISLLTKTMFNYYCSLQLTARKMYYTDSINDVIHETDMDNVTSTRHVLTRPHFNNRNMHPFGIAQISRDELAFTDLILE